MFDAIRVNVRKVDQEGNLLNGATLQIYKADGTTKVGSRFTASEFSSDLAVGSYILREENAPDGYRIAKDIPFTVNSDGTVTVNGNVASGNRITMQDLPGITISIAKSPLEGAQLKLFASDGSTGNSTWTWTSDSQYHEITGLAPDVVYTLREVNAPSGYSNITPVSFTVNEENHQKFIHLVDSGVALDRNPWEYYSGYDYDNDGYVYFDYTDKLGM